MDGNGIRLEPPRIPWSEGATHRWSRGGDQGKGEGIIITASRTPVVPSDARVGEGRGGGRGAARDSLRGSSTGTATQGSCGDEEWGGWPRRGADDEWWSGDQGGGCWS